MYAQTFILVYMYVKKAELVFKHNISTQIISEINKPALIELVTQSFGERVTLFLRSNKLLLKYALCIFHIRAFTMALRNISSPDAYSPHVCSISEFNKYVSHYIICKVF